MRVLAFGSRTFTNGRIVSGRLDQLHRNVGIMQLIEGDARGADRLAGVWASLHKVDHICIPADWDRDGRQAGYMRNKIMVAKNPDLAIGFLDGPSSGSMHTVRLCLQSGIPLYVVDTNDRMLKKPINELEVLQFFAS